MPRINIPFSEEFHYIEFNKPISLSYRVIYEDRSYRPLPRVKYKYVYNISNELSNSLLKRHVIKEWQDAPFKKVLVIKNGYIDYGSHNPRVIWSLYTNRYNISYQLNRIPIYDPSKVIKYKKLACCGISFYPRAFGHYVFEILPRLVRLLEINYAPVLMFKEHYNYLKPIIDKYYHDRICIIYDRSKIYYAEELVFTSYFTSGTDTSLLQYRFNNLLSSNISQNTIVLISRQDADNPTQGLRHINLTEVYNCLKQHFHRHNIVVFIASNHSKAATHRLFHTAKLVIGMHGAGLMNIVYCRPATKIIEIFTNNSPTDYQHFANLLGLDWYGLHVAGKNNDDKLHVDISLLKTCLKRCKTI